MEEVSLELGKMGREKGRSTNNVPEEERSRVLL